MYNTLMLDWILGNFSKKFLKRTKPALEKINSLESYFKSLSVEDFKQLAINWREEIKQGKDLDKILPEVFAAIREASFRVTGKRHFDVQMIGGIAIHEGKIAEMKTGEGKTLVAALPAALNALTGRGVFVVTVNDYLTKRDFSIVQPILSYLGITCGCVLSNTSQREKQEAYDKEITYCTKDELVFDYLRDNLRKSNSARLFKKIQPDGRKKFYYVIIDEIDSVLIDNARTPLIISDNAGMATDLYVKINPIIARLNPTTDVQIEYKSQRCVLSQEGSIKVEEDLTKLGIISGSLYNEENLNVCHIVYNLVRAHFMKVLNKDYVVFRNEIVIIDEFTGRLSFGRRFSDGLHQALEAKESLPVRDESVTKSSISYTNYFRLFEKIGGMSGTAVNEENEFKDIYNLDVVQIPTNKPCIRSDDEHIRIYKHKAAMYEEVVNIIKQRHMVGQPILVCAPSVFESENLSFLIKKQNLPHNLLNARNHEQEAYIVAQAGRSGAITISTNMAGRGTDILLGGNPEMELEEMIKQNPRADIETLKRQIFQKSEIDREKVVKAGGLLVLIVGAPDADKTEVQFKGRSGRQGDPGKSMTFASLEDDVLRPIHQEAFNRFVIENFYIADESEMVFNSRADGVIRETQTSYQQHYFEMRKNVLKYDNVINEQRINVFKFRDYILDHVYDSELIILNAVQKMVKERFESKTNETLRELCDEGVNINDINDVTKSIIRKVSENIRLYDKENLSVMILSVFDEVWYKHVVEIEELKKTVYIVSYEQKDPALEFRKLSFEIFKRMLSNFDYSLVKKALLQQEVLENDFDIFKNTMCFCGSGMKFDKCHGKNMEEILKSARSFINFNNGESE